MDIDQLRYHIENAPSLKLLRYDYSVLALSFFAAAFKSQNHIQIKYHELVPLLEDYLLDHPDLLPPGSKNSARHYIDQWSDDRHRFLRKYYNADSDDPVTELTYDTEQALEIVLNLDKREFVGAQSRFYAIFDNLSKLTIQGGSDPKQRLEHLHKERDKIDLEIKKVKREGRVSSLDRVEIKERFLNILDDSRRLIADFRLIEDIFKNLTREIKEKTLKESLTKGAIVGQVLDIHDSLENSDQGKSFRAFWNFLISAEKQEELKRLTKRVLELEEIQDYVQKNPQRHAPQSLLTFKNQLLQVGQKVLASQYRLSRELRKLLHHGTLAENKAVTQEIFAIKKFCLLNRDALKYRLGQRLVALELSPDIRLPLERPLWRPKLETTFSARSSMLLGRGTSSQDGLLKNQFVGIRPYQLEERIGKLLETETSIALLDVVKAFPIEHGCTELVGYLTIALGQKSHRVEANRLVSLAFKSASGMGTVRMPHIIFNRNEPGH